MELRGAKTMGMAAARPVTNKSVAKIRDDDARRSPTYLRIEEIIEKNGYLFICPAHGILIQGDWGLQQRTQRALEFMII